MPDKKSKYYYLAQKNDKIFSFKIPAELHSALKEKAAANDMALAEFVRYTLAEIAAAE